MKVPFLKPDITEADIERMVKSVRSGWLVYGPYAQKVETLISKKLKTTHAVLNSSCTASLHLALILAGVEEGDEVITTPLTWVSTSDAILYQRAVPVFADVDPETGILDLREVERKITKRTKAVMVVHLYGQMADMKKYSAFARKHKLALIEDAAHAFEASRDGIVPGQLSLAAAFSFHAAKNITSGQGGAIVLREKKLAERAYALRRNGVLGRNERRHKYELGYKYDGTDFQAALLLGQITRAAGMHKKRLAVWKGYEEGLKSVGGVSFPKRESGAGHAAHLFVIWVDPKRRDEIRNALIERGIQTSIHWDPVHLEPYYQEKFGGKLGDYPIAERLGLGCISLPTYPSLTKAQQNYVIDSIKAVV